jgi:chitinase
VIAPARPACALLGILLLPACPAPSAPEFEGDAPGECADDADNDRDGLFDCDDEGCAGAAVCSDDDDAADDDDTAPDDDDDAADDDDTAPDDDDTAPDDDDTAAGDGWPAAAFAPFVDASLYPVAELDSISLSTGLRWFALGFVVSDPAAPSGCVGSWGTYYSIEAGPDSWGPSGQYFLYDEIDAMRARSGGDVVASFGGAANSPLAATCTDVPSLVAEYTRVIDTLGLAAIDFDVEGYWVADATSVQRRNAAIAGLQSSFAAAGRPLAVWFTLPVLPSGLTAEGVALLDDALSQGVDIAGVNIMAMDYGDSAAPNPSGQMGEYAIQAAESLHTQLTALYAQHGAPRPADALWTQVGVTPMIGLNDVTTETFDLTDMQQLVDFADDRALGLLSMWSLNRDHPCPTSTHVELGCSSTADQGADYEFSAIGGAYGP